MVFLLSVVLLTSCSDSVQERKARPTQRESVGLDTVRQYAVVSGRSSKQEKVPPIPRHLVQTPPPASPPKRSEPLPGPSTSAPVRSRFFGNEATGERIAYVLDYSGSMLEEGREDLLRSELTKSLTSLPKRAKYTLVMFMAEAWWHEDSPGFETRFPDAEGHWLPATSENIAKSLEIVRDFTVEKANDSHLRGGTDWGPGLTLALEMRPKPEVVHFMTDGVTNAATQEMAQSIDAMIQRITGKNFGLSALGGETDEDLVRRIGQMNAADGKPAVINAVSMMEPEAAHALGILAKENRGTFSIVRGPGDVQVVDSP